MTASPLLVLDTGSPVVSLALGSTEDGAACRTLELRRSSEELLAALADLLAERDCHLSDLGGIVVLRGPGSFTGLRVGLATVLGLHQALGLRATTLPTLPILARAAVPRLRDGDVAIAVVDAMRGEWMSQAFALEGGEPQALEAPWLRTTAQLIASARAVVGFGLGPLADAGANPDRLLEASPLAALVLRAPSEIEWDPAGLVQPIYFRPPAVTRPASKK